MIVKCSLSLWLLILLLCYSFFVIKRQQHQWKQKSVRSVQSYKVISKYLNWPITQLGFSVQLKHFLYINDFICLVKQLIIWHQGCFLNFYFKGTHFFLSEQHVKKLSTVNIVTAQAKGEIGRNGAPASLLPSLVPSSPFSLLPTSL